MRALRGMSLMDVVIGTALIVLVFLALFGILRASLLLSSLVKKQAAATALANNQMEYIRSLPYDEVGTIAGIPSGTIPQNFGITSDNVIYNVRTFIDYYDDPADGTGAADTNGITIDYKRIKVTVSYTTHNTPKQVTLVSNYSPSGLETTNGGGTLQLFVVNSSGSPVSGASVHIVSTTLGVDLTTISDATGIVYLPGALPATDYNVSVTKTGYSTAQTYLRDATNQNPTPGYLTVVQNQVTSGTFAIDVLGNLTINTYTPITTTTFTDTFSDTSKIGSMTNVTVSGGDLSLIGGQTQGQATSTLITPTNLNSWGSLNASPNTPAGTTAVVQVVDSSFNLLPDGVLPGNSTGFSSFPVDLSGVSTSTYPSVALQAKFTNPGGSPPSFHEWSLTYRTGPTPLPNVSFTLTGAKTIGSTGGGAPIPKTVINASTNGSGTNTQSLEWDSYALSLGSGTYDVVDACDAPPFALSPGASITKSLYLSTFTTNALLVTVTDNTGAPVSGATVTLARSGYSNSVTSSSCGGAYFGSLTSASDYSVTISKSGYTTTTYNNITVSGHNYYAASFP
jgi:hypothetical protein